MHLMVLQGFAPHFDDIDAFVLQVEGAKRYAPVTCASSQAWNKICQTHSD